MMINGLAVINDENLRTYVRRLLTLRREHCMRIAWAYRQLMSPTYVKPYVKTNQHDGRDAEAIGEAVSRPPMRVVSIETVEQADLQAVHRTRSLFVKHRTAVINQIRGLLAEYGFVMAPSPGKVRPALVRVLDDAVSGLTACARDTFSELYEPLTEPDSRKSSG
jgi:transposase